MWLLSSRDLQLGWASRDYITIISEKHFFSTKNIFCHFITNRKKVHEIPNSFKKFMPNWPNAPKQSPIFQTGPFGISFQRPYAKTIICHLWFVNQTETNANNICSISFCQYSLYYIAFNWDKPFGMAF